MSNKTSIIIPIIEKWVKAPYNVSSKQRKNLAHIKSTVYKLRYIPHDNKPKFYACKTYKDKN